ncbi:MAG TPA: peptidoglycan DD-metalloendopeptidase family protein [Pyrinomonadaceae bacterium]|jgi:murein DD-endopeptidase MepM/ murein hydrolase activator NlpD
MKRDERIYAFIVAHTSHSRFPIRQISIHRRWLKVSLALLAVVFCAALYGMYSLSQEAAHLRLEDENNRLRMENEKQRHQLHNLKNRVEAVEDATRRLSEISGVGEGGEENRTNERGAGGPALLMDAANISVFEIRAAQLEQELRRYEAELIERERTRIPSIWPVEGRMTDDFGLRGNPFGGDSSEFHAGQDIATNWGTPVVAAGSGTVTFAGTQNGYGQVVILDHGNGLTTRYGHLSRIEVEVGQELTRGQELGRVGSTGRSTGPHLHYEVRIYDTAVNPRGYLPGQESSENGVEAEGSGRE